MKRYDKIMEHGIIKGILIVLLSFALVGTAAAADPQPAGQGGWGNGSPMGYYQNMMTNGSVRGYGNMMPGYGNTTQGREYMVRGYGNYQGMQGAYPGMWGGAGTIQGTGGMITGFMFIGMILAGLLMLVWLIVGVLLIVLLIRKLRKEKTS